MEDQKRVAHLGWVWCKRILICFMWTIDVVIAGLAVYVVNLGYKPPSATDRGEQIGRLFISMWIGVVLRLCTAGINTLIDYIIESMGNRYVSGYLVLAIGDMVVCLMIARAFGSDPEVTRWEVGWKIVWTWLVLTAVRAFLSLAIAMIGVHRNKTEINEKAQQKATLSFLYRSIRELAVATIFIDLAASGCAIYIFFWTPRTPLDSKTVEIIFIWSGTTFRMGAIWLSAAIKYSRFGGRKFSALFVLMFAIIDFLQCVVIVEWFGNDEVNREAVWSWLGFTVARGCCSLAIAIGLHKGKEEIRVVVKAEDERNFNDYLKMLDSGQLTGLF